MKAISARSRAAARVLAVMLLAGCGPPKGIAPGSAPATQQPMVLAPRALADVFVLEAAGGQPDDTVVTVPSGSSRVVVVRRSSPDFGIFVELEFPDSSLTAPAGSEGTTVTISPEPSLYGVDLAVEGAVTPGAQIVFSYGAHFIAPAGARERYGSNLAFEKQLAIGRVSDNGQVVFLPTGRPGSDLLSAPLAGPGRYLVAAPR